MQEIYAAGLTLEIALDDVTKNPEDASQGIGRAIDQLHEVIRNIRSYIFDLRPREFTGSLRDALTDLAREFSQNSLVATETRIEPELRDIDPEKALALYHIAHEALSNVHKHAGATNVQLSLTSKAGVIQLDIEDDGHGFDTGLDLPQQHRGMRNMSSRARAIGGYLDVHSVPGQGTAVRVEIPYA